MNAPANIRHVQRSDYAPAVQAFLPGCDGEELELRCSLMLLRDRAMEAMRRAGDASGPVFEHINRLGSIYALASLRLDDLRDLRRIMVMTLAQASAFAAWEGKSGRAE